LSELFDDSPSLPADPLAAADARAPLADRMRPRELGDFVGQTHLLGEGRILSRILAAGELQSLILWGPPGIGKTTLARLIAARSGMHFVPYSAVLSGIKEIRAVMAAAEGHRARTDRGTLVFVDEIHRFNKAQQDAFLPFVERGDVLLVGATTENPSFEVIGALLSRCRVLQLRPLAPAEVVAILERALHDPQGLADRIALDPSELERIAHASDGDARRALVALETIAALAGTGTEQPPKPVDAALVGEALQRKVLAHDKSGEEHFNLISALHKSVRNGNQDAALYWLTRLTSAGEDGKYIARRLVRMASEDIGLADPYALRVTLDAAEAFERLGVPEGELALAQAAVYLARARKSNALYRAYGKAKDDVERTAAEAVPMHLRNAVTDLMREAGYGKGYRYVHEDPAAEREMECMPPSLAQRHYFPRPAKSGPESAPEIEAEP
jgi:putative ATPase